jgi:hypothetical protein
MLFSRSAAFGRRSWAALRAPAFSWAPRVKIALLIVGVTAARWVLVRDYGSAVPFGDQWSQAASLFKPFVAGKLTLAQIFAAHNEHRIAAPRLLALALFWLNGRWDPILECCVNAVLVSLGAGFLVWLVYRHVSPRLLDPAILLALVLFALPLGWYNALWAFQSAFYLQILFSLLALWGCGLGRAFSLQWWLGLSCAMGALFTNASGGLVSISLLLICAARAGKARRLERANLVTILASLTILAVGFSLQVTKPEHIIYRAASPSAFVIALLHNLCWPNLTHFTAALAYLPMVLVARSYLSRAAKRRPEEPGEELLLLLGSWVLIQFLAIAFARGGHGDAPSPRYFDIHLTALFINGIALLVWLLRGRHSPIALPVMLLWLSAVGAIVPLVLDDFRIALPGRAHDNRAQLRNVTAYLQSGRFEVLLHRPQAEIPASDPRWLAASLDDPVIRKLLPADLQPPLPIVASSGTTAFGLNPPIIDAPPTEGNWWTSFTQNPNGAEAVFRSEPLISHSSFLRLEVAGFIGRHGISLKLIPENGGRSITIVPADTSTRAWRTIAVRAPRSAFSVVATDHRPQGWLGFSAPREIGPLSYFLLRLLDQSPRILWADVEFLLALIMLSRRPTSVTELTANN